MISAMDLVVELVIDIFGCSVSVESTKLKFRKALYVAFIIATVVIPESTWSGEVKHSTRHAHYYKVALDSG